VLYIVVRQPLSVEVVISPGHISQKTQKKWTPINAEIIAGKFIMPFQKKTRLPVWRYQNVLARV